MLQDIWKYRLHHAAAAFFADGDSCYVTRSTKLVALKTRSGEVQWSVPILNPYGWLVSNEQSVFYLNQHERLVAVDRASGAQRWSRDLRGIHGWLHASATRVVVGGWRGYTNITAIDAGDGATCWTLPARTALHSTRIHAESETLMVVDPSARHIKFLALSDGQPIGTYPAEWWTDQFVERPRSTRGDSPAIVEAGPHQLLVVTGKTPTVAAVPIEPEVWSRNLSASGAVVPFVTGASELVAWHRAERRLLRFGRIEHKRRDVLPFCQLGENSFAVATSSGSVALYEGQSMIARRKIAKRVELPIAAYEGTVVCATAGGDVVGLSATGDG